MATKSREELMDEVLDDIADGRQDLRNLHQNLFSIDSKMAVLYNGQVPLKDWREKLNTLRRILEDMSATETINLRILRRK